MARHALRTTRRLRRLQRQLNTFDHAGRACDFGFVHATAAATSPPAIASAGTAAAFTAAIARTAASPSSASTVYECRGPRA